LTAEFSVREVVDLSAPLKSLDTPVYPGYPQPLRTTFTSIKEAGYASYVWTFVEHTSTHVDAPSHFIEDGLSIDQVPISKYVGQGVVLDFSKKPPMYSITKGDVVDELDRLKIRDKVGQGWVLLFYTGYTAKSRTPEWVKHPELSREACEYVAGLGINAIGFDAPSPDHAPFPAHKILLPKTIGVYENLSNLDKLLGKNFLFVGAPLALNGGSASPVRPVAVVL
jgi:arylformamidase